MAEISAIYASACARRDPAAAMLDRALTNAVARYKQLIEQLRIECVGTRKVAVMARGTVAIGVEESA